MDLIKSGSYIDIFYAKTCATTKISTVAEYHVVLVTLLSMLLLTSTLLAEMTSLVFDFAS